MPRTRPVKPAIVSRAEMVRVVDERFPTLQRLAVDLCILERIAEHAQCRHGDILVADRFLQFLRKSWQVLVHHLPEERLEAFKTVRQYALDIGSRVGRITLDHGTDTDGFCRVAHFELLQIVISMRRPDSALSIAPNTMARLLIFSMPTVSGGGPPRVAAMKSCMTPR